MKRLEALMVSVQNHIRDVLRPALDAMRESMFFGEAPEFGAILSVVSRFEERFNSGQHGEASPRHRP